VTRWRAAWFDPDEFKGMLGAAKHLIAECGVGIAHTGCSPAATVARPGPPRAESSASVRAKALAKDQQSAVGLTSARSSVRNGAWRRPSVSARSPAQSPAVATQPQPVREAWLSSST